MFLTYPPGTGSKRQRRKGGTMPVRFYFSPQNDPHCTLALEEAYLRSAGEEEIMLYLYRHRPSVIIGRTQNAWAECRHDRMENDGICLARRITGGGAVYHDEGNLNFSFIAGSCVYDVKRQLAVILEAVRGFGIDAGFSGRNDLVAGGRKFSGNAFGIRKNAAVHHGTLLISTEKEQMMRYLSVSPDKIAAKGVASVRSRVVNLSELAPGLTVEKMVQSLRSSFADAYGEPEEWTPDPVLCRRANTLAARNAGWKWLFGRTPAFDLQASSRFSWGGFEMQLQLEHGIIRDVQIYSDAMDPAFILAIPAAWRGVPFRSQSMADALEPLRNSTTSIFVGDIQTFLLDRHY